MPRILKDPLQHTMGIYTPWATSIRNREVGGVKQFKIFNMLACSDSLLYHKDERGSNIVLGTSQCLRLEYQLENKTNFNLISFKELLRH